MSRSRFDKCRALYLYSTVEHRVYMEFALENVIRKLFITLCYNFFIPVIYIRMKRTTYPSQAALCVFGIKN